MSVFEDRQEIIEGLEPIFRKVEMKLEDSLGHILQQKVFADFDMPPFNKSAMDGYACRKEDLNEVLDVLEILAAGSVPSKNIGKKQCSKIMTGAALPEGADCVFMIEDAVLVEDGRIQCNNPSSKLNICYLGEDYKKGEVLLKEGIVLNPEHLAVIAGTGLSYIYVAQMPRIGLIVTGSELVEYSEIPEEGKIRNTNAIQFISLLRKLNMDVNYYGLVKDNYDETRKVFQQSLKDNDVVILTGGAAIGDFDLVPDVIKDEGFEVRWSRTGLKPGNPMSFAVRDGNYVFGLSGNPVSSFVQFEYLVKPIIYKLLGSSYKPLRMKLQMAGDYFRKNADRFGVVPVRINQDGLVDELPFNGSAHIAAFSNANALMEIPVGVTKLNKGEMIYVRPI
jgi:molybdopterin molybdotransferase